MLLSLPEVANSVPRRQEDFFSTMEHRPLPLGKRYSPSLRIIQNFSISILDSAHNCGLRQVDEISVSVRRHRIVDSKYGQDQVRIHSSTSVERTISPSDSGRSMSLQREPLSLEVGIRQLVQKHFVRSLQVMPIRPSDINHS